MKTAWGRRFAAAALICWLQACPANAADIKIIEAASKDGPTIIGVDGDIVTGDAEKFRQLAAKISKAAVVLNSGGGKTIEAIEIGKVLRIMGYSTYVGNQQKCSSSCGLIFLAGSRRFLDKSAMVGFHAAYVSSNNVDQESGVGNAIIGSYISQLNYDQRAVIFATTAAPNTLNYLTNSNAASVGIPVEEIADSVVTPKTSSTANDSRVYASVQNWTIAIDDSVGKGCFMLATYPDGTALRIGYDNRPPITFTVFILNDNWKSIVSKSSYKASLQVDEKIPWSGDFKGMNGGGFVGIYLNFDPASLFAELRNGRSIKLTYDGQSLGVLNIPGVAGAIDSLAKCESENTPRLDPFAGTKKDPFAH